MRSRKGQESEARIQEPGEELVCEWSVFAQEICIKPFGTATKGAWEKWRWHSGLSAAKIRNPILLAIS